MFTTTRLAEVVAKMFVNPKLTATFLALVLGSIAASCQSLAAPQSRQAAMTWGQWKALSGYDKDAYVSGAFVCRVLRKGILEFPDEARDLWIDEVDKIGGSAHSEVPVIAAFDQYAARGKKLKTVASYFNGDFWRQTTDASRVILIRGYSDEGCNIGSGMNPLEIAQRVSLWYGIDKNDASVVAPARANVSINKAIESSIRKKGSN